MKNDFEIGSVYYLKIDTSKSIFHQIGSTLSMGFEDVEYRINNGAWISVSQANEPITLEKLSNQTNVDVYDYNQTLIGDFSNMIRFEIWGRLSIGYQASQEIDEYLKSIAIKNPITIELDRLNCENNVVNKLSGSNLIYVDKLVGSLREEINLLSPSIVIEYNKVPDFNYIYIPSLQRYYFVTNITNVRYRVYRIDLKVDVLTTYNTDIRKQRCFITRNETPLNRKLVDEERPLEDIKSISYSDVMTSYGTPDDGVKNITFSYSDSADTSKHHWMVNTYSEMEIVSYISNGIAGLPYPNLGGSTRQPNDLIYFGTSDDMHYLTYGVIKNSAQEDYILSVIYYPFDVTDFLADTTYHNLCAGSAYLNKSALTPWDTTSDNQLTFYQYTRSNLPPLILADFTITSEIDETLYPEKAYLNYEPFREYELYIPFVGWVKVPAKEILNTRVVVLYAIDITTGDGTMYIFQYLTNHVIYSCPCRIGFKVPLSKNNKYENEIQRENNNLSMGIGLLGASITAMLGAISNNPLALAGGIVSGVKSISGAVSKNSLLIPHTSVSYQSTETSIYPAYRVLLKVKKTIEETIDESVYAHTKGYPINQYDYLTNYTGYTEIPEMHYKPDTQPYITKTEIDEIVSLARDGIIL